MSNEQSVSTAVSELIDQAYTRETLVKQKIVKLEAQVLTEKATISQLMKNLIDAEMAEDEEQAAINKELVQHRTTYGGLEEKIRAYRESLDDKCFLRDGVVNVFEIAQSAKEQRYAESKARSEEVELINKQISELIERRDKLTLESRYIRTRDNVDEQTITSLFKYVENRPISFGDALNYLRSFADGASREELEQRFVIGIKQKQAWIPPYQQTTIVSESERTPGMAIQGKTTTFEPYGFKR